MQIMDLVLFCPKHNFNIVKQQHKVDHVKLGIFPPHSHIKIIKFRATLLSYEIKCFNMALCKINTNIMLNILNMDESDILLIYTIS